MPFLINRLSFLLLSWLLITCHSPEQERSHPLTPAFYHWQTTFNPNPTEITLLRQLGISKLYIRFFDVDWNLQLRQPIPNAVIQFKNKPAGLSIVPVVFITNRTLQHLTPPEVPALAQKIAQKIQQIASQNNIRPVEVQLDCDWTGSTRDRYFVLLQAVKKAVSVPLSATIRLHQIKYTAQTGVPPVDRGMLMFYNMADWKQPSTQNSIYDLDVARRYTAYLETYPLPLDIVMPLFRWTVVYRNTRFLLLLNNVAHRQLVAQPFLQMQKDTNRFVAQHDTVAFGMSIRRGDLFRAEACLPNELLKGKNELLNKIQNEKSTFALYHLDTTVLKPFNYAFLQSLLRSVP